MDTTVREPEPALTIGPVDLVEVHTVDGKCICHFSTFAPSAAGRLKCHWTRVKRHFGRLKEEKKSRYSRKEIRRNRGMTGRYICPLLLPSSSHSSRPSASTSVCPSHLCTAQQNSERKLLGAAVAVTVAVAEAEASAVAVAAAAAPPPPPPTTTTTTTAQHFLLSSSWSCRRSTSFTPCSSSLNPRRNPSDGHRVPGWSCPPLMVICLLRLLSVATFMHGAGWGSWERL